MKLYGHGGLAGGVLSGMVTMGRTMVPAGEGRAVRVGAGRRVRVVDVEGGQVGDLFAFAADDPREHLSAAHTRSVTSRLFPQVGESFVTDRRRPILTLADDTSPGSHDMLIAACDPARYEGLGAPGHASCARNLESALAGMGLSTATVPQPVNVFMRIPVEASGRLRWLAAESRAGDAITFEAVMDCVVVVSACPQDLAGINADGPTPMAIDVL
ncbi:urea carboxylase-associated family protein [Actinomadura sp. NPDC048021]|uniref:urea carboxylase-associated family protein n=1 Tax=Actinomadura sp. NPDC048021 TaxID=3155385 RepID=UPI0033E351E8